MRPIDRRAFLALGAGALAWACSRDAKRISGAKAIEGPLSVIPTGQAGFAIGDSRQALVILDGQKPFSPQEISVRLISPAGKAIPVEVKKESVRLGRGGDDDKKPGAETEVLDVFVFRHEFDEAGDWRLGVDADGLSANAAFNVAEAVPSPTVGNEAISSQSPTTGEPRGVDPICTRTPVCSLHEMTIAQALAAGKPLVISFGTPRYCTSRTCGPVLDVIEAQSQETGEGVAFVHVEVWRNDKVVGKPGGDAPVFAEWKLSTEPWTYFTGSDGVVKDRWLGPVGVDELKRAVDALAK